MAGVARRVRSGVYARGRGFVCADARCTGIVAHVVVMDVVGNVDFVADVVGDAEGFTLDIERITLIYRNGAAVPRGCGAEA